MLRQDQHVDPEEAQEIVRLAARQQANPIHDGPTVQGLAEALSLPPEEVQRLLAQVRQQKMAAQAAAQPQVQPQAQPQRQFGDRSAALSAGIVLALVLVLAIIGGAFFMVDRPTTTPEVPPVPAMPSGTIIVHPDGVTVTGTTETKPATVPDDSASTAPATATTPTVNGADLKAAEESLRQAQEFFERESKTLSDQDRQAAQAKIDQAQAEINRLKDQQPAVASGG